MKQRRGAGGSAVPVARAAQLGDGSAQIAARRLVPSSIMSILAAFAAIWLISRGPPGSFRSGSSEAMTALVTPAHAPRTTDLSLFAGEHQRRLYWGSYRPNVYFGMKPRARTLPLLTGLMWLDHRMPDPIGAIRHTCEEADHLRRYGWTKHDGTTYGRQELLDVGLSLTTEFAKDLSRPLHPEYKAPENAHPEFVDGGDWAARVSVKPSARSKQQHGADGQPEQNFVSLFFYALIDTSDADGHAHLGSGDYALQVLPDETTDSSITIQGSTPSVGTFRLQLNVRASEQAELHWTAVATPHVHNVTDQLRHLLREQIRSARVLALPNKSPATRDANLVLIQLSAEVPVVADLAFYLTTPTSAAPSSFADAATLTSVLAQREAQFDRDFEDRFHTASNFNKTTTAFAKAALSNLLGGIGYFYGRAKVTTGIEGDPIVPSRPMALFTAVPSRSFFPRGFVWDEGFHELLVLKWNPDLTRDILAHWFDLMNQDGWIPREVILGAEAESRVPAQFVVQRATHANPPTFLIALDRMLRTVQVSQDEAAKQRAFLVRLYPRLQTWFAWFNRTQSGPVAGSYRWRGRDATTDRELNPKTLTSGLDDFPRASHPSDDERHVDLFGWMSLAARLMHKIALIYEQELSPDIILPHGFSTSKDYQRLAELLDAQQLKRLHWNGEAGMFCDYGNHTEQVKLVWYTPPHVREGTNLVAQRPQQKRVLSSPNARPTLQLVPQLGYVSLFPLLLGAINSDDEVVPAMLRSMRDPDRLWTSFGLRSLSKDSRFYLKHNTEHDGPYWRGPVWINMNYLALGALHRIAQSESSSAAVAQNAGQIYSELRSNIIGNMLSEYHRTGYIWEQYDVVPENLGKGKGSHPFTGWSALVVLILGEVY
ncbi:mannosyl-oligosaccharide glucosidase [Capsaspora owczarzaki ATCC 30864]|uniref:Mannosyl-oligosaccharide glucosidase n=1 Tax=Capsaspora owczarzaki (strain ATCC 30864) TaxID=595528 RepID=A0A0D2X0C3_CAPO3|nr:mannosyl-oligosaccharide glucosidase [Capsaspora owczarzaki ATCC 30864]KJE88809.1 mannosyl-oligosaccharide glucosidase [Capsaspora owczarzaki ATCC 30864]|eukprot:XP_004365261.1 mannosyl-oligosaccharide glucosidase [Capsaspora owczarzaki ATCC 30864]